VRDGREIAQPHSAIKIFRMPGPAINDDIVPAATQPRRQLLGKGLKSAIPCRNAPGAEDGDTHSKVMATNEH